MPLLRDGSVFGVLDPGGPLAGRFDVDDRVGIEAIAAIHVEKLDWSD